MRRYETIVIIQPGSSEDEVTAIIDKSKSIIEERGGSILQIDKWGIKRLAYLIGKHQQGYYVYVEYAGLPEAVDEMERIFRIDDRVMKFLTVKLQDVYVPGELRPRPAAVAEEGAAVESDDAEEVVGAEAEE